MAFAIPGPFRFLTAEAFGMPLGVLLGVLLVGVGFTWMAIKMSGAYASEEARMRRRKARRAAIRDRFLFKPDAWFGRDRAAERQSVVVDGVAYDMKAMLKKNRTNGPAVDRDAMEREIRRWD